MDTTTAILVLVPFIAVELGLLAWGLWDLTRPERRVRGVAKPIWAAVIIFVGFIGPLAYFLLGRDES